MFSLWHSSHESANAQYSFFPKRFKDFLALGARECQWATFGGVLRMKLRQAR